MIIDPSKASGKDNYFLMISTIVPRPIAWISSRGADGSTNLAPFSYFQGITAKPPMISVCIGHRRLDGKMVPKDTVRNIKESRDFVVNIPSEDLAEKVNQSSAEYPPGTSELDELGLTAVPSDIVKAPRIAEAPISFECKLDQVIMIGTPALTHMIIAEVVRFHICDDVWNEKVSMVDTGKLRPLARLGGTLYGCTREIFSLPRPDWEAKGVEAKVRRDKDTSD